MNCAPLPRPAVTEHLEQAPSGSSWREFLEPFLADLPATQGDLVMMLMEESRGAWAVLLAQQPGTALFIGNAVSGTVAALATMGWKVTVADPSPERCAFAKMRDREYSPGQVSWVHAAHHELPFQATSFDLVVREDAAEGLDLAHAPRARELCKLSRGAVVHLADNRFAYKRATGRRGHFRRHSPLSFLGQALFPPPGLRSLMGHRRELGSNHAVRALALYPDGREFSHVINLDGGLPRLTVGPREKVNIPKVLAKKAGLLPLLTPSFALLSEAAGASFTSRLLAFLAETIGEEAGQLDQLIATRSNCAMLMTAPAGVLAEEEQGPLARSWVIHIPLSPGKHRVLTRHVKFMGHAAAKFPVLNAPEVLFEGTFEGVYLCVSRRIGGWTAPHATDQPSQTGALAINLGRILSELVVRPTQAFSEGDFERLLGQRFERVAQKCHRMQTRDRVQKSTDALRENLVGAQLPLVFHHADLRAKHLIMDGDSKVRATLDFGSAEAEFLPLVDLLHHLGHQRKEVRRCGPGQAWQELRDPALRAPHEDQALREQAQTLGLESHLVDAILDAYPLFVAAMAEANWDWSRPEWIHREFGW